MRKSRFSEDQIIAILKESEGGVANDPNIAPSMIYAYAALQEGVPFANSAPNLTTDIPVMLRSLLPGCRAIIFSGQAATADALECYRQLGYDFEVLAKPMPTGELVAKISSRMEAVDIRNAAGFRLKPATLVRFITI